MAEQQQNCGGNAPGLKKIGEIIEEIDEGDVIEIVEIELFARENKKPPRARKYKIRIDKIHRIVEQRIVNGKDLLEILSRQCLDRRLGTIEELEREVSAWEADRNTRQSKVTWRFTNNQARIKLRKLYPSIE